MLIRCPWCGPREEPEFRYGGQAHVHAPKPDDDDQSLARQLFQRANPVGPYPERWFHAHGCRRWFNVVRDTMTHQITDIYVGERGPENGR